MLTDALYLYHVDLPTIVRDSDKLSYEAKKFIFMWKNEMYGSDHLKSGYGINRI